LRPQLVDLVRDQIRSAASLEHADIVAALPKTRPAIPEDQALEHRRAGEPGPSTIVDPAPLDAPRPIWRSGG
jgi:hypothetical protein